MDENTKTLEFGKATPEQLEAWKKQYKKVVEIVVTTPDGKSYIYLRKYGRVHIERAYTISQQEGLLACGRYLLDNLFIAGDERVNVLDNDDYADLQLAAQKASASFFDFFPAEVKNY